MAYPGGRTDGHLRRSRVSFSEAPPSYADRTSAAFTGLENGSWVVRAALPTLEELRAQRLAELAALRWEKETGGTTFNGMHVATDAVSETKYIGAVVGAQIDPNAVINWKMADGAFVIFDAQAITAVAMAARTHVQACFDREAVLKTEIEAAKTIEDICGGEPEYRMAVRCGARGAMSGRRVLKPA